MKNLAKAFDRIDHSILLQKLTNFPIFDCQEQEMIHFMFAID